MLLASAGAVAAVALTGKNAAAESLREGLAEQPLAAPSQQAAGAPLASLEDYEKAAHLRMSPMAYEYVAEGAGDEKTLSWNHDAYNEIRLRNRVLVDVSHIDTSITLLGHQLAHPILLSPTAYHKFAHPEGEVATARGAGAAKAAMIVSSFATTSLEDIAKAATGPLWFQLY